MDEIKKLIGKRIKYLRKEMKLSQEKLAELIGIDQRNLGHIERGDTFPSKTLPDIANALKIKLPELFDFEYLKYDDEQKIKYINENLPYLTAQEIETVFRVVKAMR